VSGGLRTSQKKTHPPDPVGKYETHRYAAILEQPGLFRDTTEKLSHELFTKSGLGYMRDEMQLGVYYTGLRVLHYI